MAISDVLSQLKDAILGVKSNKIDDLIDSSLDQISKYSSNSDSNKFIDAFKSLVKDTNIKDSSIFKALDNANPQVQNYDQSGRIGRYQEYDSICSKIPYCQRALETWVDHIVSPDDILKTTLEVIIPESQDNSISKLNTTRTRINTLIDHFELENKTKNIVRTTLKKGDNFIEFVITKDGKNSLVVLNESKKEQDNILLQQKYTLLDENNKKTKDKINVIVEASNIVSFGGPFTGMGSLISSPNYPNLMVNQRDISGMPEWSKDTRKSGTINDPVEKKKKEKNEPQFGPRFSGEDDEFDEPKDSDRLSLNDLSIVIHDPKYVIKLETQRFRICLGYLVFPKVDVFQTVTSGVMNNVDAICSELLKDIKKKLVSNSDLNDDIKFDGDVRKILASHLLKIEKNEDLKIRFVSPHLMQHFKIESSKYEPYGESIFDSCLFQCRMYIALETALLTKKINACSDKRFINIEMGLPRDAAQLIERMKDSITKKKISVGELGNIDTIPSQISTFETIYLPQKDGKKFVDIEHQNWGGDTSNDNDQLKTLGNGIVGSLGVPAPYVGIEENASNRSILTTESINFCRSVISKQQELSIPLKEFFYKAFLLIWGKQEADLLKHVKITFQQPKISPTEHYNEILTNTANAINALSELGISKEFLKRKFMPYIDWNEADNYNIKDKLDKEVGDEPTDDSGMGGGFGGLGGMGGGMAPSGGF